MSIEELKHPEMAGKKDDAETGDCESPVAGNQSDSNVLLFSNATAKSAAQAVNPAQEAQALLGVYDQLIALLRETDNEGLDILTDSMVLAVVKCRKALVSGSDDASGLQMVKELRAGLRETPQTLRSLLPGLGPRLGESLEHKLGIQFSQY